MIFMPALFSVALFTSAFLSFSVQPILGKMLLPMVGGAPAGWIVAMAFFQIALLAGYGISYYLGRFSPWVHALGLLILYVAGFAFLPPVLPPVSGHVEGVALSLAVVEALAQTVLVPFLALTATTAALQRVFAATKHKTANDPYYLFVASNIGSFAGLFIYPFLLEPSSGLAFQTHLWKSVYYLAVGLIVIAVFAAWRNKASDVIKKEKAAKRVTAISGKQIFKWLLLAFVPCSLSMGSTTLITTDIGGLPLFWVIPLGLYLLTFILAFSSKRFVEKKNIDFYHIAAATFMVLFLGLEVGYQPGGNFIAFAGVAILILGIFFIIAWMCHQRLADDRPATEHLALFYFILALGGALAGALHAFVLPFVLSDIFEFPLMVVLSLFLVNPESMKIQGWKKEKANRIFGATLAVAVVALITGYLLKSYDFSRAVHAPFYFIALFCVMFLAARPHYLAVIGLVALITSVCGHYPGDVLESGRNFFGARAVYDRFEKGQKVRFFAHGNTLHGLEVLGTPVKDIDYGYYLKGNPIRDAMDLAPGKTIAITGLGAGQLACYEPKAVIDFYEIDSDVERIAKEHFSYMEKCPPREIIIGDGRLMLEKSDKTYDMIILDAFTSDGIPMHLVTQEAFKTYHARLKKNGLLLFHVSNRYLDLPPALAAIAESQDLKAYEKFVLIPREKKTNLRLESLWVAVPLSNKAEGALLKKGWVRSVPMDYAWSDDRSSLLDVFDIRGAGGGRHKLPK